MTANDFKQGLMARLTEEVKPDIVQFLRKWAPEDRDKEMGEDLGELFARIFRSIWRECQEFLGL